MLKSSKKSSKDKSKASTSDDVTFDPQPKYDAERQQWYFEGRRNKGDLLPHSSRHWRVWRVL